MPKRSINPELARRLKDKTYREQITHILDTALAAVLHHPQFARSISEQEFPEFKELVLHTIYELAGKPPYYDNRGDLLSDAVLEDTVGTFLILLNDGQMDNLDEILR